MTLVILGIDGLDDFLIDDLGATQFRLTTSAQLETFAYSLNRPHTVDVWPSMATGVLPDKHGVSMSGEWDNGIVEFGSKVINIVESLTGLGFPGRDQLEETAVEMGANWEPGIVSVPTMFDKPGRYVYNWPGVRRNDFLLAAWEIIYDELYNDRIGEEEFRARMRAEDAAKFTWIKRMLSFDTSVIATHIHGVDSFSHAFCDNREKLATEYTWYAKRVETVLQAMCSTDELLIVSDHGMETKWYAEQFTPADHSWRAVASSTMDTIPSHVLDVPAWVDKNAHSYDPEQVSIELPEEQLRELGYI